MTEAGVNLIWVVGAMELNRALPRLQALLMHMLLTALAGTRRDKYVVLFLIFFEANSTFPLLVLSIDTSLVTRGKVMNLHFLPPSFFSFFYTSGLNETGFDDRDRDCAGSHKRECFPGIAKGHATARAASCCLLPPSFCSNDGACVFTCL